MRLNYIGMNADYTSKGQYSHTRTFLAILFFTILLALPSLF